MGFWSNLFRNAARTRRLLPISQSLGARVDNGEDWIGNLSNRFAEKDAVLERLLDICESDEDLAKILSEHGTSRDELRSLYHKLFFSAGLWRGSNFVPVSTLGYPKPLDFLLTNNGRISDMDVAYELTKMFVEHRYL